jgi:hypothetical protein
VSTTTRHSFHSSNLPPADINPIGGISKTDLKRFVAYARDAFDLPVLTTCVLSSVCEASLPH